MRRVACAAGAACLLGGATVLAFFSGGYFAQPRLVAALVTWALVLALAVTGPAPLPGGRPGRLALAGLVALTLLTAASIAWAPLRGPAVEATQRLVLYTGTLALAVAVLRAPAARRAVEPALAAGATLVIGYGLAPRLLPDLVTLARSASAGGRLEQPLTYWNAEGALAAVGLVLCARLAGDPSRPRGLRAAAAAAVVPLGAGVYLSYSRGALAVAVLGLVVLVAAAPSRAQLAASATALATGVAAAVVAAALPWVAALEGDDRARDGAVALVLLLALAALAAALTARRSPDAAPLPGSARRLGPATAVVVAVVATALVVGGLAERPTQAELAAGAGAERLTTVSSNRYEYWRVGARAFAERPLAGLGAGGFRVFWLQEREIGEAVKDTHSLPIEVAAELGLAGLVALGVAARRRGPRGARRAAPGPRGGGRAGRGARRLAPARVHRLGLADARGDPAGDRARRHADRARRD